MLAQGGKKVDVILQLDADASSADSTNFIFVKHRRCIPGDTKARALGVLHIGAVTHCNAL